VLVIAIVVMASMVVVLRGKSQQNTVLNVSNLNSLESASYIRLNNTIWQDPLGDTSPWHVGYSQPNMTARVTANGGIYLNVTIPSESYPQAVNLYRSVNFSLIQNPILIISLDASVGIHYGIRIAGQDSSGTPFQAWSESSYLQHRSGIGKIENFTISALVEAYRVNGIFSAKGSSITSLLFYIEATPGQTGQFVLDVRGLKVVAQNQYSFNSASQVQDMMDEITLTLNYTDNLGFTENQFAQGYIDYYIKGSPDVDYTVYFMHGLTVVGQGFEYSARSLTYNIATFSASKVTSYPPLLVDNNTFLIVLSPLRGSFVSFQLGGFSIRYLSQAPSNLAPSEIDPSIILPYYLIFLFVTPVAIVILVSRLLSNENNQTS
jgi:hypothetical protein